MLRGSPTPFSNRNNAKRTNRISPTVAPSNGLLSNPPSAAHTHSSPYISSTAEQPHQATPFNVYSPYQQHQYAQSYGYQIPVGRKRPQSAPGGPKPWGKESTRRQGEKLWTGTREPKAGSGNGRPPRPSTASGVARSKPVDSPSFGSTLMKTVGDKVMGFAKQKGKIMRVEGGKQAWSPSPCLFIEQLSPTAVKLANPAFAANTAAAPIPFQPPTSPPLSSASSNHTLIEPFASASTSLSEVDDSRDDSSYPSTGRPGSSLGCPAGDKASPAGLLGSASVSNSTLTLLGSSSTSVTSSLSTLPSGTAAPQGSTSTAAIASRMTLQSPVPTMTQWASSKVGEQAQLAINLFQATSVYTSPENQTLNITEDSDSSRERLNLNRRNLYNCLLLPNDTRLRLLNYQNNFISRIENLDHLKCLVFLDFYNNQIERIAGLSSLVHLRVLMLGRNRIKKIENLGPHTKLDVLDLHSNQIKVFENINHLQDLRVLNLEDNEIERVEGVEDLLSLAELNLKRNKIVEATNLCQLDTLKRLNLSHNEISSYEDIALTQLGNLIDFSIENNPVTHHTPHRSLILNRLANLKSLDGRRITDEERRTASKVAKREMERRKEWDRVNVVKEERERVISFIEGTWTTRTIQSTIPASDSETSAGPSTRSADPPTTLYLNSAGRSSPLVQAQARFQPPQLLMTPTPPSSRPGSASTRTGAGMRSKSAGKSRAFVPGGASKMLLNDEVKIYDGQTSYLELNGGRLSLFGPAHPHLAQLDLSAIHTAHLTCMDMPSVALAVSKLADALNLHTLVLDRNRFTCLKQVNLLSPLRTLTNFEVLPTDNPVTNSLDFRAYVLFRLGHLRLKSISGVAVESGEIESAERTFGSLRQTITRLHLSHVLFTPSEALSLPTDCLPLPYRDIVNAPPSPASTPRILHNQSVARAFTKDCLAKATKTHVCMMEFAVLYPALVQEACERGIRSALELE